MTTSSTIAYLADGTRVTIPERQYGPELATDRKYRAEPLRGYGFTLAVFFNPAPSNPEQWECVGWTVKP